MAFHGRHKRLRQDDGIFDQVGHVKHQPAPAGFAVQHGQPVGQAQHPGGGGGQAVGQVVAVIQKLVGGIGAVALLAAGEVAIAAGLSGQFVELLGQAGFFGQQGGGVGCRRNSLGRLGQQRLQRCQIDRKPAGGQAAGRPLVGPPLLPQALQAGELDFARGLQAQRVVKPEAHPVLQVLGGAVFALRLQPGDVDVHFGGGKQRRAATAAKPHQHARLGQLAHGGLGDGGARAQQHGGGVGDGDVPVQRLLALFGHVLDAPAVDEHAAVLQVVQVGPLGMQDGFEIAGANVLHGGTLPGCGVSV